MTALFAAMTQALGLPEFPVLFRYVDELPRGTLLPPEGARTCLFALLATTRAEGRPVALSAAHHGCPGGGYYLGFLGAPREGIEHFLSCGIPGKMEGERYLKTPELARARIAQAPVRPAPGKFGLFTRADAPPYGEKPEAVIFFANPDQVAGLHMLAGFDRADDAVVAPFSSGCGAIVTLPLAEAARTPQRAVLGLFDPSARPFVEPDLLTFAVPYAMFERMAGNAGESFLTRPTWGAIRRRISGPRAGGPAPGL
ncbi:MAG: DUF169 domain-containing protein [Gemmatimonadota bacterium]